MRHVRAVIRLMLFSGVTACAAAALLFGVLFTAAARRPPLAWRARLLHRWSRAVTRVINIRVTAEGLPPRAPFFLVSNHLGYVDVAVLGSLLPSVFVARGDLARWPVLGWLCRSVGTLFLDRTRKRDIPRVLDGIRSVLDARVGVVVFPEGTSSRGETVLAFRPSLLEVAARAGLPVSYCSVSYRVPGTEEHERVCWWGPDGFVGHLYRLLQLPRIDASVRFGARTIRAQDRKVLAARLWEAVSAQFRPVVGPAVPNAVAGVPRTGS